MNERSMPRRGRVVRIDASSSMPRRNALSGCLPVCLDAVVNSIAWVKFGRL
jgi:hypothetical protein